MSSISLKTLPMTDTQKNNWTGVGSPYPPTELADREYQKLNRVQSSASFTSEDIRGGNQLESQLKYEVAHQLAMELLKESKIEFHMVNSEDYFEEQKLIGEVSALPNQIIKIELPLFLIDNMQLKNTLTLDQKKFLWKLLPPKINGISPDKHPLGAGWNGILQTKKDKQLGNKIAKHLNQNEK